MRGLVTFILILLVYYSKAQVILSGKITDSIGEAIPSVRVYKENSPENFVYSDKNGIYNLQLSYNEKINLIFNHVGFESLKIRLSKNELKKLKSLGKITLDVSLDCMELAGVVVEFNRVDTIFGNDTYSVEDYLFYENSRMLLLAFEKNIKKSSKLILAEGNEILFEYAIPFEPEKLYQDYSEKNYIVGKESVYQINVIKDSIILREINESDFYGFYSRVIDTIENTFYYSNYNELYPAVKFLYTEKGDTVQSLLWEVKDDFMMELYRAQYKYVSGRDKLWAYRKEQETGIDKEIWIGAVSFTNDILYKPIYAPLFVINDTTYVFDHYKNKVLKFDEYNDLIGETLVDYHFAQKEKWKEPLFKDEANENIYVLYDRGGYSYLRKFDVRSGKLKDFIKLDYRFIENIKIKNNKAFYIYRPFESLQKKFIYSQDLY